MKSFVLSGLFYLHLYRILIMASVIIRHFQRIVLESRQCGFAFWNIFGTELV